MNFAEFIAMGGYGGYVWGAVGLSVVVLIINVVAARRRFALAFRSAMRRSATEEGSA